MERSASCSKCDFHAASAITPKPTIRRNNAKLQVMSEEILEAIKNKKTAF
jgi:hypothetical protein